MADRRDQKIGDKVAYYDEHGLNQQRASNRRQHHRSASAPP
jgi:hypothetical protein